MMTLRHLGVVIWGLVLFFKSKYVCMKKLSVYAASVKSILKYECFWPFYVSFGGEIKFEALWKM